MSDDSLLLRQKPPTPTRFNRKILSVSLVVFGLLVLIALGQGLQGPSKATPEQIADEKAKEEKPKAVASPPPAITNNAESYAKVRQKEQREKAEEARKAKSERAIKPLPEISADDIKERHVNAQSAIDDIKMMERIWASGLEFKADAPESSMTSQLKELAAQVSASGHSQGVSNHADAQMQELMKQMQYAMPGQEKDEMLQQNQQDLKSEFVGLGKMDDTNSGSFTQRASPYILAAGDLIPVSLLRGINTDLPGNLKAIVTQNVYDSYTGNYLLIPQGSEVNGTYQNIVSYGQERVLAIWTRLCRPDGGCVKLGKQIGVDTEGYSGLKDEVDNHYGKLAGGVLASSILAAGAATSQGVVDRESPNFGQLAAAGAGEQINDVGGRITRRNLNVQPTLTVRPGERFNIQIDRDFVIPPYQR